MGNNQALLGRSLDASNGDGDDRSELNVPLKEFWKGTQPSGIASASCTVLRAPTIFAFIVVAWIATPAMAMWPSPPQPDQLTLNPCEAAGNVIYLASDSLPTCYLPPWAGGHPGYEHCDLVGPRLVAMPSDVSPNWWNGSSADFGDTYDPKASSQLRALVWGKKRARTVEFTANWYEYRGGGTAQFMVVEQGTNNVLINHVATREEGQGCNTSGLCELVWTSPPLNVPGAIAAGVRLQRTKWETDEPKGHDQWMYTVCQDGCSICTTPAASSGWTALVFSFAPLLLLTRRRLHSVCVLALAVLLPVTAAHAQRTLPHITVTRSGGEGGASGAAVEDFEAVPGMYVTTGEPVEGGCRFPEVKVTTGPATFLNAQVVFDENCVMRVGNVDTSEVYPDDPDVNYPSLNFHGQPLG